MTTYETRVVDPTDEVALRAWWEVGRDATAERPIDAWPVWEISREALPMARTDGRLVLLSALEGDVVAGTGMLFPFRQDNTHLGEVDVYVAPPHRGRGIGRAVLAELERHARRDGRTTITATWTSERLREGEDRAIKVGRVQVMAVAVAPDGHLLGLAMKLATHRRVLGLFPECVYVETGNAGVNAAMNAVNAQLGYRVVERCLDVQKRL